MPTIELAGTTVEEAAARALAAAGASASSLDFVIVVTGTGTTGRPELAPGAARRVAERLGIGDLPLFRLTEGRAGTLQGFYTARALLAAGLGPGLVIGPDGATVVDADDCSGGERR